jgi:hypothetical protein
LEGYKNRDDWSELLRKIATKIGISEEALARQPKTYLALWEAMLCGWAESMHVYPYKAEAQLQKFVCDELRKQEQECLSFSLYKRLADAGFDDIISLNFDRRIALSCGSNKFIPAPDPCPLGKHGESLFRHSLLARSGGESTRIWYPHGDAKKATTIKLGVRLYGFYIGICREYLHGFDNSWRFKPNSRQVAVRTEKFVRGTASSWVDLFLTRPLLFVGCGLSADEWPLWWLLRQRALKPRISAQTYYVSIKAPHSVSPPHFQLLPNIQMLLFDSVQELWEGLLGAISKS